MICSFGMQAVMALSVCAFTGSFKEVCRHHMESSSARRLSFKSASSKAFAATTEARIGKHTGVSG